MKAVIRRGLALALGLCTLTIPASAAASFTDISGHWANSYITQAASKGLVSGIGNNQYGPELTLSNAEFITMVSNLFYAEQVKAQGTNPNGWWIPYMNVATAQGLLNGTTALQQGSASGWTKAVADAKISRFDMAQIIYNLGNAQRWETPDAMSLVLSQLLIKDYSSIPTSYQMAVVYCFAKGFLSGDQNSNFNGSDSTTRAQAAVVLCNLDKAKTAVTAPTYTNPSRLANGLAATEENVADLLDDLQSDYPSYYQWDMTTTYTSQRLGVGSGNKGFAYMLSDKVFGGMPANPIDDPKDLRLGDVIALNNRSEYGVVWEVTSQSFSYVACDSNGWVYWNNDMDLDELDGNDIVYTRYLDMPKPDDVLANGKEATRANVEDILDDLKRDDDYEEGAKWYWDDEYTYSDVFDDAFGHEGLAYRISDEIFGDLEAFEIDDEDDIRVGDVIYDGKEKLYGVVVDVDYRDREYTYVSLDDYDNDRGKVHWSFNGDFDYLDLDRCYTRYPEDADYDYDRDDKDTLYNGKEATEENVESILDSLRDSNRYGSGEVWDESPYTSDVLGKGKYAEAFAYALSDRIFDELEDYEQTKISRLKLGDIVYGEDDDVLGVVVEIDKEEKEVRCATLKSNDTITWNSWVDYDEIYTIISRYP